MDTCRTWCGAKDNKYGMTVPFACTLCGSAASQLIYSGQTTKCHLIINLPAGGDVWYSDKHWITEETMDSSL